MNEAYVEKIGSVLSAARGKTGLTIDDAAERLRINPAYLRALEDGSPDVIPAPVFFKGFLKNYADFLKLNTAALLRTYGELSGESEQGMQAALPGAGPAKTSWKNRPAVKYGVLAGIFLVVFLSWLRVVEVNNSLKSDIEKRKSTSFRAMTTAKEMALHEEKKKFMNAGQKESDVMVIRAKDSCWVEIRYEDNKIFQGLLFAGETREFSYRKGLIVKLGNAGAVEIVARGRNRNELGKAGEVKEVVID